MIGRFVLSKAGHDRDEIYVVVEQKEDGYVCLCDGRLRPLSKPKKKNLRHIQPTGHSVEDGLLTRLKTGERVYDEEIRNAVRQYRNRRQADEAPET